MLRRVENVNNVKDSLEEMMRCVQEMMDLTYREVQWVLNIDRNKEDDAPLLSTEHLLTLFDVLHVDMQQAVRFPSHSLLVLHLVRSPATHCSEGTQ